MHEAVKLIYGLLTGDITLICLFSAIIIYSVYIFSRNNFKNPAAKIFSIACIASTLSWLLIDIFPGVNVFLLTLFFLSGAGLAAFAWIKKDKLFPPKKENINPNALIILFFVLYVELVLKTAWLGDDSFITFRTVDNFIHGFGLTWNVEERVQAYTNTLWMFAVSALYFITRNVFTSVMLLSAVFMFLAVYSLKKSSSGKISFAVVFFSLIMSKAFIDYSTSGLENPLTFCLLAVFYRLYFEPKPQKHLTFLLSLTASLIFLNKPDAVLLVIFPLIYHIMLEKQKSLFPVLIGAIPVAVWEIFSVIYYGFPLPNTFYVKLFTGVPSTDVFVQGLKYVLNSLCMDPLTLALALSGVFAGFYPGDAEFKKKRLFSIGIIVYILYVIKAGGDFMTGRFFTPAEFTGALLIASLNFDRLKNSWMAAFAAALFFGFLSPYYSASRAFTPQKYFYGKFSNVTDERQFYFLDDYGIKSVLSEIVKNGDTTLAFSGFALDGLRLKAYAGGKRTVSSAVAVGMRGFFAGPSSYIIDNAALADAFLARVPFDGMRWRPGHVGRAKVEGYIESLTQGTNVIKDPKYSVLFDKINLVTKGELFTAQRWKTIWELNTNK